MCIHRNITPAVCMKYIPYCMLFEKQITYSDCVAIVCTLTTELFHIPVIVYEAGNMEYQDMHVGSNLDKLKHFRLYSKHT